MFFLRFDQADATAPYRLTKELHLSRLHNPHRNELHEHYCRRWVSLRALADGRASAPPDDQVILPAAQRSHYFGTPDEYLCFTLARVSADPAAPAMSVTVGLRVDDTLREQIKFVADPALTLRTVNETCERCPIPDCEVRAAAPVQVARAEAKAALEAAVAALVAGQPYGAGPLSQREGSHSGAAGL